MCVGVNVEFTNDEFFHFNSSCKQNVYIRHVYFIFYRQRLDCDYKREVKSTEYRLHVCFDLYLWDSIDE